MFNAFCNVSGVPCALSVVTSVLVVFVGFVFVACCACFASAVICLYVVSFVVNRCLMCYCC